MSAADGGPATDDARRDWLDWHRPYDDPESRLSARLRVVQGHIRTAIEHHAGPLRFISMCAGQGRDLLPVLAASPRRAEISAVLVELDPRNAEIARASADSAGLSTVGVICADASQTDIYEPFVPAQIVLACGIFGNITDDDVKCTIEHLPSLCTPGATVVWTRGAERDRDIAYSIRDWFNAGGFEEIAFDAAEGTTFRVGVHRLVASPPPLQRGVTMFRFFR